MKYDKNIMNSLQEAYKSVSEEQDLTGITLKQKKELERQKQLFKKQKEAPVAKSKIVSMKTRTEEAIKMSRKEYNKTHPVSTPVKITDEVDKKKEMEDKMKEVEDMRSLPTRMNLIKTKLRAMGLNMSHVLKGNELSEVTEFTISELNRYEKETGIDTKTGKKIVKGGTAKDDKAFQLVMKKYDNQRMGGNQKKMKKGEKGRVQPGDRKGLDYETIIANRRESEKTKNDAMMDTKGT